MSKQSLVTVVSSDTFKTVNCSCGGRELISAPHSCFAVELKEELEAEVLGRVVGEIMRAF